MTARERIWRNIREAAMSYEAPPHLSDDHLVAIAKRLDPLVPIFLADAEAFGMTKKQWIDREADI